MKFLSMNIIIIFLAHSVANLEAMQHSKPPCDNSAVAHPQLIGHYLMPGSMETPNPGSMETLDEIMKKSVEDQIAYFRKLSREDLENFRKSINEKIGVENNIIEQASTTIMQLQSLHFYTHATFEELSSDDNNEKEN